MSKSQVREWSASVVGLLLTCWLVSCAFGGVSQPIVNVLREPLPPEDLTITTNASDWTIEGPTFTYTVPKTSGLVGGVSAHSKGEEVIDGGPLRILMDDMVLENSRGSAKILSVTKDRIEIGAEFALVNPEATEPKADCTMVHSYYNDGVVVSAVSLKPHSDLIIREQLACAIDAEGDFSHWLHKRRDEHGEDAARAPLPTGGGDVGFATLTSCLQVFSSRAGLALFTDSGAAHLSKAGLQTAVISVKPPKQKGRSLSLRQYVIRVAPGGEPFVIKAGEDFRFRVGLSLTPNRVAHRRMHDLRMFAWLGDLKYPYPTDGEIVEIARAGFTVFQMHRLGTPGEPRPPAGELERVIQKVHEVGMLFLWAENADLMYASAPGVQDMQKQGKFVLWQGFNYGGRYKARMDPYCDLIATCLASPNGLAEYRMATYQQMMQRFEVDGIYLDDNLAYGNCALRKEHGHPHAVYDCLIELHEMNWKRRQFLRERCPHTVIVSHNTKAIVLPVVCDFDALLYGEGYSFNSLRNYWDYYRPVNGMPSQGMIWPGDDESARCPAALAYNYDLITGGGQYCQIDWRWYPKKFSYATGVSDAERVYVQTYNMAQYNFGLYESETFYFADCTNVFGASAPQTYASVYRNTVWNEWLLAIANMIRQPQKTALQIRSPAALGLEPQESYTLFDVHQRTARTLQGTHLNQALSAIEIPGESLQLYVLQPLPRRGAYHVWGGKRLKQEWDEGARTLWITIQGPAGLKETVFLGCAKAGIQKVLHEDKTLPFFFDPEQGLAHGDIVFTAEPVVLEVRCSKDNKGSLPSAPVPAGAVAGLAKR